MAGYAIRIDTDQVAQIATDIENQNLNLKDELERSSQIVKRLASDKIWEGEAAEATCAAVEDFATRYFEKYQEVISQYVQFLRTNVEQGYLETEAQNTALADAFK